MGRTKQAIKQSLCPKCGCNPICPCHVVHEHGGCDKCGICNYCEDPVEEFNFKVVDDVETLPGTYMYKDGELVPYGAPYPSTAVVFQRLTLRECKAIIDKYDEI
jgi:hypothetical protein